MNVDISNTLQSFGELFGPSNILLDFVLPSLLAGLLLARWVGKKQSLSPSEEESLVEPVEWRDLNREVPFVDEVIADIADREVQIEQPHSPLVSEEKEIRTSLPQLSVRLKNTRLGIFDKIRGVFSGGKKIDADTLDELEMLLISSDLGVKMVTHLLEGLRREVKEGLEVTEESLIDRLKERMMETLQIRGASAPSIVPASRESGPTVIMIVGVNGAGKTTTIAKLSRRFKDSGAKVVLGAADTFRAAAVDQLSEWGDRLGVSVVSGLPNAKPASVVFDAMVRAKEEKADVLLIDTAGRLHTKSNLMQELEGIKNSITRHQSDAPHETILVVDGTTGQNALSQAREFNEVAKLTGVIVTKLDGTAKGGIVVAIKDELNIPIRYIGVGESWEDLRPFDAKEFVDALFDAVQEVDETRLSAHGATRRRKRREEEQVA